MSLSIDDQYPVPSSGKLSDSPDLSPPDFLARSLKGLAAMPFIRSGIDIVHDKYGEFYRQEVNRHLETLFISLDQDWRRFDLAITSFIELTIDTLRMQHQFLTDGTIAKYSSDDRFEKVYNNAELMQGPYLKGLYLAHFFWPNHFEKVRFFHDDFLPALSKGMSLIDIGTGPGTFTMFCRTERPDLGVVANDISPYSRDMVESLLKAAGDTLENGFDFIEGDFLAAPIKKAAAPYDAAIFSEVVEHLPDPQSGLQALRQLLRPGARIFFTTATNAAFYDHTVIFRDVAEIEALLAQHGFLIEKSLLIHVFQSRQEVEVIDYSAIIRNGEVDR
jgi:SAM-dependent methyltransferase